MQSLTYQQSNGFISAALINRAQPKPGVSCGALRDAVRAWSAVAGQDVVTALIVEEWHRIGGEGIDFPADHSRARQITAVPGRSCSASWITISTANGTARTSAS